MQKNSEVLPDAPRSRHLVSLPTRSSGRARVALALGLVACAAASGAVVGADLAGSAPTAPKTAPSSATSPAAATAPPTTERTAPDPGAVAAAAGSDDPAATTDPAAFYAGRAMAGNGDTTIPLGRAQALAAEVPSGAEITLATNTLRFDTRAVSLTMLASPPGHDMTFRSAGMTDPTIEVPQGSQIAVQFINGDSDMAHMWLLAPGPGTNANSYQSTDSQATIVAARPLGDPTAAGQPAETIYFPAPPPGHYHYYCAFPGHAAQGMHGRFIVEP